VFERKSFKTGEGVLIMKKTLATLLALLMILSALPLSIFPAMASAGDIKTGDIIAFGSYPQTRVVDTNIITALNACALSEDNTALYNGANTNPK